MAKIAKTTSRRARKNVNDLIDQRMETAMHATPVDHESQIASWTATEPTLPELTEDELADLDERVSPEAPWIGPEIDDSDEMTADEVRLVEAEVSKLEALESQETDEIAAATVPLLELDVEPTFDELRESFPESLVEETVFSIAEALDERAAFETDKNPDNANIHRTLKKVRSQLVTKRAAKVMLATNLTPAFINRSEHTGSRYNVYALGKLADVIFGVTDGAISNAINLACMRSLFRFKNAGIPFTMEMAKAAASDKIRVDAAVRQHLVRHTVSASTAPTQASSTMQALETLGVVKGVGGTKSPTFVPTEHPIVAKLEEMLAAA